MIVYNSHLALSADSFTGVRWNPIRGDELVEAARICIGVNFPNLAAAALARSMERFVCRHGRR
jgi:hypothetical protein